MPWGKSRSSYGYGGFGGWAPYVPVAERRANALAEAKRLAASGRKVEPIVIRDRKISTTVWGQAWCANLESYSDFANRLPRGRSYVRNGSVIDLQIHGLSIEALVSGSEIYKIKIELGSLPAARWKTIRQETGGKIGSLVELLKGQVSKEVMLAMSRQRDGLFPAPKEIQMRCSCPDSASLCKHLAAVLYGVGHRLDTRPELLFSLRGVDAAELVSDALTTPVKTGKGSGGHTIASGDLADLFGIELDEGSPLSSVPPSSGRPRGQPQDSKTKSPGKSAKKSPATPPVLGSSRRSSPAAMARGALAVAALADAPAKATPAADPAAKAASPKAASPKAAPPKAASPKAAPPKAASPKAAPKAAPPKAAPPKAAPKAASKAASKAAPAKAPKAAPKASAGGKPAPTKSDSHGHHGWLVTLDELRGWKVPEGRILEWIEGRTLRAAGAGRYEVAATIRSVVEWYRDGGLEPAILRAPG
jgi:hypothetical protein